jgi:ATP-dependent HslUV protease subunit HslV
MLAVVNKESALLVSGNGDVIEPENGIVAIGSGGPYALAAARAFSHNNAMTPREMVEESLKIAGEICIYTNTSITVEEV